MILLLLWGCSGSERRQDPPFLWEVQSPSGSRSYMLGTIHVGVSAFQLADSVWEAFAAADTFIAESDIRPAEGQQASSDAQAGWLPEGKTLDQLIPQSTWQGLVALLPTVDQQLLRRVQPWLASILIQQVLAPPGEAMDLTFTNAAAQQGKRLIFLETYEEVASQLDSVPQQSSIDELIALVDNPVAYRAGVDQLISLYRSGDEAFVRAVLTPADGETDPNDAVLLTQRNRSWLPALVSALERGPTFVAVGLAHILGQDSLPGLLAEHGFALSRIDRESIATSAFALRDPQRRLTAGPPLVLQTQRP